MDLSFSQVVSPLSRVFRIKEDRLSAFSSRIKNLQRGGMLPDINTGRGVAARYGPEHVFLIASALQLIDVGLTPERAIEVISQQKDYLGLALQSALAKGDSGQDTDTFVLVEPQGLNDFRRSSIKAMKPRPVEAFTSEDLIAGLLKFHDSVSILNISRMSQRIIVEMSCSSFEEGLKQWAEEVVLKVRKLSASNDFDSEEVANVHSKT